MRFVDLNLEEEDECAYLALAAAGFEECRGLAAFVHHALLATPVGVGLFDLLQKVALHHQVALPLVARQAWVGSNGRRHSCRQHHKTAEERHLAFNFQYLQVFNTCVVQYLWTV